MTQQSLLVWLDGELVDAASGHLSLLTHALHYGTAAFEGIRSYKAQGDACVFRLQHHLHRLLQSAHALGLATTYTSDELSEAVHRVLAINQLQDAYIRPLVFVGPGSMSLDIDGPSRNSVHVLIAAWEWKSYFHAGDRGLGVRLADWKRSFANPDLNKIKSSGFYVSSYLAQRDAKQSGFDDAILVDENGKVAEATVANVFLVAGGALATPRLHAALPGITRDTIIELARDLRIPVHEQDIDPDELQCADEVFLTGTACEIAPIVRINEYPVGSGTCGDITAKIACLYRRLVRNDYAWAHRAPPTGWWARARPQ